MFVEFLGFWEERCYDHNIELEHLKKFLIFWGRESGKDIGTKKTRAFWIKICEHVAEKPSKKQILVFIFFIFQLVISTASEASSKTAVDVEHVVAPDEHFAQSPLRFLDSGRAGCALAYDKHN